MQAVNLDSATALQPANKQRRLQQPHLCSLASPADQLTSPQQKQPSKWANFVDTSIEVNEATQAETNNNSNNLSLTPNPLKPLQLDSTTANRDTRGLHHNRGAAHHQSCNVQKETQQGTPSDTITSNCDNPPTDSANVLADQPCQADKRIDAEELSTTVISAAPACKAVLPVFPKPKAKVFKPPAVIPGYKQNSQCIRPVQQPSCGLRAAQGMDSKPAFVVDARHPPARHCAIPTSFASLLSYKQCWVAAVTEEINIKYMPICCPDHNMLLITYFLP